MESMEESRDFLGNISQTEAYNIAFNMLKGSEYQAINSDVDIEYKIKTIELMIEFFTEIEEYEKCAYLHSLKLEITKNKNGNLVE